MYDEMAGRIMAHSFTDEMEKIALSKELKARAARKAAREFRALTESRPKDIIERMRPSHMKPGESFYDYAKRKGGAAGVWEAARQRRARQALTFRGQKPDPDLGRWTSTEDTAMMREALSRPNPRPGSSRAKYQEIMAESD